MLVGVREESIQRLIPPGVPQRSHANQDGQTGDDQYANRDEPQPVKRKAKDDLLQGGVVEVVRVGQRFDKEAGIDGQSNQQKEKAVIHGRFDRVPKGSTAGGFHPVLDLP